MTNKGNIYFHDMVEGISHLHIYKDVEVKDPSQVLFMNVVEKFQNLLTK